MDLHGNNSVSVGADEQARHYVFDFGFLLQGEIQESMIHDAFSNRQWLRFRQVDLSLKGGFTLLQVLGLAHFLNARTETIANQIIFTSIGEMVDSHVPAHTMDSNLFKALQKQPPLFDGFWKLNNGIMALPGVASPLWFGFSQKWCDQLKVWTMDKRRQTVEVATVPLKSPNLTRSIDDLPIHLGTMAKTVVNLNQAVIEDGKIGRPPKTHPEDCRRFTPWHYATEE